MRLLVTGGAGFIGSHYVRSVLCDSWGLGPVDEVVVLDKLTYAGNLANLEPIARDSRYRFVQGDIANPAIVGPLVKNADIVLNFAAETHVDRSIVGADDFVRTNIVGTQVLLDAVKEFGVEKFIQVSTDEVYGSIDEGSWTEESPLLPNSPYSAAKASGDLLARAYFGTHDLPISVTRCSNNYGPYQFVEKVIPLFVTNLMQGKKVPLYGDGLNIRDWLHVDDHCRAIHLVALGGKAGEIYNIGGGTELTNKELTDRLLKANGADWSSVQYVQDRPGHDRRYSLDHSKITRELGYEPKWNLDEGLAQTIKWYQDNQSWWKKN